MIFMSQSGLLDAAREADWDAWYIEHLRIMTTVTGIPSAQRFKTVHPAHPPSLAIYTVASAAVFDDPYYLGVRGLGEFLPLIDRRWYRRNLFAGMDAAPLVGQSQRLVLVDRDDLPGGEAGDFDWLEAVGLDRSTRWRGIAVVDARRADELAAGDPAAAIYRPATAPFPEGAWAGR